MGTMPIVPSLPQPLRELVSAIFMGRRARPVRLVSCVAHTGVPGLSQDPSHKAQERLQRENHKKKRASAQTSYMTTPAYC